MIFTLLTVYQHYKNLYDDFNQAKLLETTGVIGPKLN